MNFKFQVLKAEWRRNAFLFRNSHFNSQFTIHRHFIDVSGDFGTILTLLYSLFRKYRMYIVQCTCMILIETCTMYIVHVHMILIESCTMHRLIQLVPLNISVQKCVFFCVFFSRKHKTLFIAR